MLFFLNMLFEKTIGFWVSKYANFQKLAYKYAIWQPCSAVGTASASARRKEKEGGQKAQQVLYSVLYSSYITYPTHTLTTLFTLY